MATPDRNTTVGFIGLGQMGGPMAANLLKKGHPVVVFDIDKKRVDQYVAMGAKAGSGPADLARRASRVISMVDTTGQAEEVICGPGGIIDAAQAGDVVISMSTIDPVALQKMAAKLAPKGIDIIDSPVTGMEKGAIAGTLNAYIGGTAAALEKARPVLESMTSTITHIGSIGQGTVMKLINNMLMQVNRVLITEALVLGAKAGLDPQLMVDIIGKATGNSVAFQYTAPKILKREFEGIRMDITYKDVELQTNLARSLGVPMFIAPVALQVYQMAKGAGLGSKDAVSIVTMYEQWTGVPVVPRKT